MSWKAFWNGVGSVIDLFGVGNTPDTKIKPVPPLDEMINDINSLFSVERKKMTAKISFPVRNGKYTWVINFDARGFSISSLQDFPTQKDAQENMEACIDLVGLRRADK